MHKSTNTHTHTSKAWNWNDNMCERNVCSYAVVRHTSSTSSILHVILLNIHTNTCYALNNNKIWLNIHHHRLVIIITIVGIVTVACSTLTSRSIYTKTNRTTSSSAARTAFALTKIVLNTVRARTRTWAIISIYTDDTDDTQVVPCVQQTIAWKG